MRNRRLAASLSAATVLTGLLAACASDDGGSGTGADDDKVVAKVPHHMPADSLDGKCIQDFADQAAETANVEFQITPAGALGGEADVEQNLFEGVFQATLMSNVLMGVWEESAQVTNLPFVVPDAEAGRELMNSEIMQPVYDALLEGQGARVLGWCHFSQRDVAATTAVRTPDDFAQMKIRVPETDAFVKTFDILGANPTALPYPEVYNSLKTGVVDAAEGNMGDWLLLKWNEVAPVFSPTHHMFSAQAVVVNEEWFQGLSEDQQEALTEAARSAEETSFEERMTAVEGLPAELEAAGVELVTDVDYDAFDEVVSPIRDDLAAEYGVEDLLVEVQDFFASNG